MEVFKKITINKPIFIVVLSIIFFLISCLASLIGFEMFLNEEKLLQNDFLGNEVRFYLLFISVNGLVFFFFFLARGLWKLEGWSRYFMLGSSFVSLFYSFYNVITIIKDFKSNDEILEVLLMNIIYIAIYTYIIKYFTICEIEKKFNK